MRYTKGYKYRLEGSMIFLLPKDLCDKGYTDVEYMDLRPDLVGIKRGYSWNGASGPMPDLPSTMRASLFHDCWYQMIREGLVPESTREAADIHYRDLCIEDGMIKLIANVQLCALTEYYRNRDVPKKKIYQV